MRKTLAEFQERGEEFFTIDEICELRRAETEREQLCVPLVLWHVLGMCMWSKVLESGEENHVGVGGNG